MSQPNVETVSCDMSDMWQNNEKNVYIEIWYGQILLTGQQDTRNAENKQNKLLYMQELPLTTPTKMYVCVATQMCRKIYVKYTTK